MEDIWTAEKWNANREDQKVSWTSPLCEYDWHKREGGRGAVRVVPPEAEVCVDCGEATRSGIYYRIAPADQTFKAWEWEEKDG